MLQLPAFIHPFHPNHVYKLDKALYGLKQSPRAWYTKLSTSLLQWDFLGSKANSSMFIYTSSTTFLIILIYVDDIIIIGNNQAIIDHLISSLHSQFALKDHGSLYYFLGIEVHFNSYGLHLSQTK